MIFNILTSIIKLFLTGIAVFSMSVMLIAVGAMAYGGIVETIKVDQKQSG